MRAIDKCVVVFVLLGLCSVSQAEPKPAKATAADGFRLHNIFGSHMVIQRDRRRACEIDGHR